LTDNFKKIKPKIRALSIYQIAGGIIGLAFTVWLIINNVNSINGLLLFLILVAFALYSYSIYCGALLLRDYTWGLKHTLINQVLQVLNFAMLGYAFQYVSGVYISIGIDLTESFNIKFNTGISAWQINFNSDNQLLYVNLNLIALYLIVFTDNLKVKVRNAEIENQLSDIIQTH